ncbi:MAG: hypothetical protein RIB93_06495 [Coleofasciculus sp. D1-CHI-01]|uniref:hypothetical protein n=1 Tax=Coleofasciculus sp. D1-CHI-01 TaxID=3068482 RepID=UPI0032F39069
MTLPSISLPFSFANVYEGFAKAQGILRVDENALTLEFEIKDNLFGVLKSGIKEVIIPIQYIESVTLNKSWLRTALVVRVQRLKLLSYIPKHDQGQVWLYISRNDRYIASQVASFLRLRISENEINLLDTN